MGGNVGKKLRAQTVEDIAAQYKKNLNYAFFIKKTELSNNYLNIRNCNLKPLNCVIFYIAC